MKTRTSKAKHVIIALLAAILLLSLFPANALAAEIQAVDLSGPISNADGDSYDPATKTVRMHLDSDDHFDWDLRDMLGHTATTWANTDKAALVEHIIVTGMLEQADINFITDYTGLKSLDLGGVTTGQNINLGNSNASWTALEELESLIMPTASNWNLGQYFIGSAVFENPNLQYLDISGMNGDIPGSVFSGFAKLHTIVLPDRPIAIGDHAFPNVAYMSGVHGALKNINLSQVTSIGGNAFANNALEEVDLSSLTQLTGTAGLGAFYGNTELKKITFGSDITSVPSGTFSNCTAVNEIHFTSQTAPVFAGGLGGNYFSQSGTVYYPAGGTGYTAQALELTGNWDFVPVGEVEEPEVFTVTFETAVGNEPSQTVSEGDTLIDPGRPGGTYNLNHYQFIAWYNGDMPYDFTTPVTDDIALTAKWLARSTSSVTANEKIEKGSTVEITLNPLAIEGAEIYYKLSPGESAEYTKYTEPITINEFTQINSGLSYVFLYTEVRFGDKKQAGFSNSNNNGAYILFYEKEAPQPTMHTVTFETDGGTVVDSVSVPDGDAITKPANPTKEGFDFLGWFLDETEFDFTQSIEADITLTARWEKSLTLEEILKILRHAKEVVIDPHVNSEGNYTAASYAPFKSAYDRAADILENPQTVTIAEVKAAYKTLISTYGALVDGVNKSLLEETVRDAEEEISNDGYTPDSTANLQAVLNEANELLNNPGATQDQTDAMWAKVMDALESLLAAIDNNWLAYLISLEDDFPQEDFTPDTWSKLAPALATAKDVYANETESQTNIDDAADALDEVYKGMLRKADKTTLSALILRGEDIARFIDEYDPRTVDVDDLNAALTEASRVLDNENISVNERDVVDSAYSTLYAIVFDARKLANKAALMTALGIASSLELDGFTSATVAPLLNALGDADTMIETLMNEDEQSAIDGMTQKLYDLMNALQRNPVDQAENDLIGADPAQTTSETETNVSGAAVISNADLSLQQAQPATVNANGATQVGTNEEIITAPVEIEDNLVPLASDTQQINASEQTENTWISIALAAGALIFILLLIYKRRKTAK